MRDPLDFVVEWGKNGRRVLDFIVLELVSFELVYCLGNLVKSKKNLDSFII